MSFLDDYEPVVERLAKFWADYPEGRVWTECPMMGYRPGEMVVFRAAIYKQATDAQPWATGFAHQRILGEAPMGKYNKPNESAPEWTSPYEVCETSAIGRALANANYTAKGKRATKEEMQKTDSANELFDVTQWITPLTDEAKEVLKEWWKGQDGPHTYSASAVPGSWLGVIREKIEVLT